MVEILLDFWCSETDTCKSYNTNTRKKEEGCYEVPCNDVIVSIMVKQAEAYKK